MLALWCAPHASAQTTCVGPAIGIPANGTPPHWWDNVPPQSVYFTKLDDPRWVGAGSVNFGDGTTNNFEVRELQDANFVYLSFRARHVVVDVNENSMLYFGIQRPAPDNDAMVVRVNLSRNDLAGLEDMHPTDTPGGGAPVADLRTQKIVGGVVSPTPAPAWLTNTLRVWVNSPEANSWGVEVQIPKVNLVVAANAHKMYFELLSATLGSPVPAYAWPNAQLVTQDGSFNDVYPDPATQWQNFQFSSGPGDPACATAGVSLDVNQIGTTNPDMHSILFSAAGPPGATNTFFANVQNNAGRDINPNEIKARFRTANWGSNPMGWEAGVDVNTLWASIPGGDNVLNAALIPNGTLATAANSNRFNWQVTDPELTLYRNPNGPNGRLPHQCMLVELLGVGPTPLQFVNNSVRTNMNFVSASEFKDTAELTIKGLTPIAPDGRDVYVWIETLNMPAKAPSSDGRPQLGTTVPNQAPAPPASLVGRHPSTGVNPPAEGKPAPVPSAEQLAQMAASGQTTADQIEKVVPTMIVHVYHDTGKKLRLGGVDRPVLTAQGSFGYYVTHSGPLYGWSHQLVPEGFTLEKIKDDFYVIRKLPNASTVRLAVAINAMEQAPAPVSGPLPWWVWLLIVIVVIIILILILKKK